MLRWLVDRLIARARRTPYFHLTHADGTAFMERYWLMPRWMLREESGDPDARGQTYLKPKSWVKIKLRLHRICSRDHDRDMHDHPFMFISWVLRDWYIEARPEWEIGKVFREDIHGQMTEPANYGVRGTGSIALRRAKDRHRIDAVGPEVWTLIVQFPKSNDWGFFTPRGKIPWQEYRGVKSG